VSDRDLGHLFDAAEASFERAVASSAKTGRALTRADDVMARLGNRDGAARQAARRERQRLNAGLGRTLFKVGFAVFAVWLVTVIIGLINPIGIFGLIGAVLVGLGLVGAILYRGAKGVVAPPRIDTALPNGMLVDRLDSYLYRARPALPAPAQVEVDALLGGLPNLKSALEKVGGDEPEAQDARRLLSTHLPNLVDRYLNIPRDYRDDVDGEGMTPDQRLVEALKASREALGDVSERLAKGNLLAFETQGRFIETRYKDPEALN
jgi:hypothetical protein